MLTTFYLDPECLDKGNFQDDASGSSAAQIFTDLWKERGVWVRPGAQYEAALEAALNDTFPQAAILIRRVRASGLVVNNTSQNPPPMPIRQPQDVDPARTGADLAIISAFGAMGFGFANGQGAAQVGLTEVVRFDCLPSAARLRSMTALSRRGVRPGEDREAIWADRFSRIGKLFNTLFINDQWAIKRLLEVRYAR